MRRRLALALKMLAENVSHLPQRGRASATRRAHDQPAASEPRRAHDQPAASDATRRKLAWSSSATDDSPPRSDVASKARAELAKYARERRALSLSPTVGQATPSQGKALAEPSDAVTHAASLGAVSAHTTRMRPTCRALASPVAAPQLFTPSAPPATPTPLGTPVVRRAMWGDITPPDHAVLRLSSVRLAWGRWRRHHAGDILAPRMALPCYHAGEGRLRAAFALLHVPPESILQERAAKLHQAWHRWRLNMALDTLRGWLEESTDAVQGLSAGGPQPTFVVYLTAVEEARESRGTMTTEELPADSGRQTLQTKDVVEKEQQTQLPGEEGVVVLAEKGVQAVGRAETASAADAVLETLASGLASRGRTASCASRVSSASSPRAPPPPLVLPSLPELRTGLAPAGSSFLAAAVSVLKDAEARLGAVVLEPAFVLQCALKRRWSQWVAVVERQMEARRLSLFGGPWGLLGRRFRLQCGWVEWLRQAGAKRVEGRVEAARLDRLAQSVRRWLHTLEDSRGADRRCTAGDAHRRRAGLRRWVAGAHEQRECEHAAARKRALALSFVFDAWLAAAETEREDCRLTLRTLGCDPRRQCAIRAWHQHALGKRRLSLRLVTPAVQTARRFEQWLAALATLREGARLRTVAGRRRLSAAAALWRDEVAKQGRLGAIVGLRINPQRRLQVAWREWGVHAAERAWLHRRAGPFLHTSFVWAAFEQWGEAAQASRTASYLRRLAGAFSARNAWTQWWAYACRGQQATAMRHRGACAALNARWQQWQGSLFLSWRAERTGLLRGDAWLRSTWRRWRRRLAEEHRFGFRWKVPRLRLGLAQWRLHVALARRARIEGLRADRHRLRRDTFAPSKARAATRVLQRWRVYSVGARGCATTFQFQAREGEHALGIVALPLQLA